MASEKCATGECKHCCGEECISAMAAEIEGRRTDLEFTRKQRDELAGEIERLKHYETECEAASELLQDHMGYAVGLRQVAAAVQAVVARSDAADATIEAEKDCVVMRTTERDGYHRDLLNSRKEVESLKRERKNVTHELRSLFVNLSDFGMTVGEAESRRMEADV